METKELLFNLFVNDDKAYANAWLDVKANRMNYNCIKETLTLDIIEQHIQGNKTIGVYELKGSKVKWACLDFDLNTREDFLDALKLAKKLEMKGFHPLLEKSGGGEYKVHIWIFCDCEATDISYFLEDICDKENIHPHEIFPKQSGIERGAFGNLVKLPLALHLKTKEKSYLLSEDYSEIKDIEIINKKLQYHLNNIDKLPKIEKIIEAKKEKQYKPQTIKAKKFDPFFNYVLRNTLPDGTSATESKYKKITGISDNIIKNLAIWLLQKKYTLKRVEEELKPIYIEKRWNYANLKGWFEKAERGELSDINIAELVAWCKTYDKSLLELLPKGKEEEKDTIIKTSFFEYEDKLYEQYYDKETTGFIVYNTQTNEIKKINKLEIRNKEKTIIYLPQTGDELKQKYVSLPSNIEEYENDEKLEEEIKIFIKKWLDVPEEHLTYAIWSIKQSWIYDRLRVINYLRALGDTGLGKTRYLTTIGSLYYKPIQTSGASTAAPIFRIINKWRGSLLIDEMDLRISDETADIIKIINLGFEKNKPIMRCDKNDLNNVEFFDPYCPKILASRKTFEDKATESRCFTTVMEGTERTNIPVELDDDFYDEAQVLRNKLLLWRFKNYKRIDIRKVKEVELGDLEPRVRQAHVGFLPLFLGNKVKINFFKKYLQEYQENLIQERKDSFEGRIVTAICELLIEGQMNISSKDIIEKGQFVNTKDPSKPYSPVSLSKYLKTLGFKPKRDPRRVDENTVKKCIVFDIKHIRRIAKRYDVELPEKFKFEQQKVIKDE